jgi:hypothetical protein
MLNFLRNSKILFREEDIPGPDEIPADVDARFFFAPIFLELFYALHVISFLDSENSNKFSELLGDIKLIRFFFLGFVLLGALFSELRTAAKTSEEIRCGFGKNIGSGISEFLRILISEPRDAFFEYEPGLWATCLECLLPEFPKGDSGISDEISDESGFRGIVSELEKCFWIFFSDSEAQKNSFRKFKNALAACPKVCSRYDG